MKHVLPLAIVIPAFKPDFLRQTLDSIARQTCKNYVLYVLDDAGPGELKEIADEYAVKLKMVYHRFGQNMGSTDLVGHWERCMDIVQEEWVWLFSDDDLMDEDCVECFYRFISLKEQAKFVRFNTRVIDEDDNVVHVNVQYPERISSLEYLWRRLTHRLQSNAVEYVFQRSLLLEYHGFENFPLAWCADDATWTKLANSNGLFTIPGPLVSWRLSGQNISSINSRTYNKIKFDSCLAFLAWANHFLSRQGLSGGKWLRAQVRWLYSKLGHIDKKKRWSTYVLALGNVEAYLCASPIEKVFCRAMWVELKAKGWVNGRIPGKGQAIRSQLCQTTTRKR